MWVWLQHAPCKISKGYVDKQIYGRMSYMEICEWIVHIVTSSWWCLFHITLVAMLGLLSWYPIILVKTVQLICYMEASKFQLLLPDLHTGCNAWYQYWHVLLTVKYSFRSINHKEKYRYLKRIWTWSNLDNKIYETVKFLYLMEEICLLQ